MANANVKEKQTLIEKLDVVEKNLADTESKLEISETDAVKFGENM